MSTPTKNINAEKIQGNLAINSITASTISATTYQNLPLDIRVTGATYNNNTFTYTNNTGGTFSVLFNSVTGLTVNGGLSATTLYGDGSNITGINFSQLATTAHTHSISDVINLQTNLDGKIDKPASPFLGDYLYYNGITWVPNQVNIPVAAGAGVTLFLSITGSSLPTYEYLSQFPIELTESQEPVTVNNSQALIGKYATEQLNRTVVDPGIWEFNTYASVDIPSTGLTQIIVTAYLLTTGNTETFLFSASTENITTTAATLYTISVVEPQYSCSTSDYLVVNYSASTTNNFNTVVTLYHGGNINYSHIHTPFVTLHNDLAGLQGGFSNEYYHLSKNEVDLLTNSVDASSIHNHDSLYLGLGGGTITGNTEVAGSFSASTYLGLPIDVFVTGATYNNANQFSFTNNTGGTFNVSFNQVTGLTATTISATTYQNLPSSVDTFVTGFTYSSNTFTLNRNQSLPNLTATINSVTGLTINGSLLSNSISATTISGGTLYGDGTNLTGTNTIVSNTVFVSTLGNDSTGSRTNMGKPFLTLEAALTAATSGDTIVVFPGSYTVTTTGTTGLAKDGVSWYFNPNTNVTKSTSGSLFVISGFTGSFNVLGYGNFTCNGSAGNVWQITGNRQNVNHTFEFDTSTCTTTDTIRFNISGAGSYTYTNSINIRGRVCQSSGGRAIYSVFTSTAAYGLNQVINIDTIRSTNSNAIRLGDSYSVLSLTFNYCESTTTDAIWLDGMVQRVSINSGPYVSWGGSNRWAYVFGNNDNTYISSITINTAGLNSGNVGFITNLNVNTSSGTLLQVNGFLRALTQAGGQVRGYSLGAVTISSGTLFAHHVESITMTGGLAYIDNQISMFSGLGGVSISSGNIYIKQADVAYGNISITGGKLEVDRITFFSGNDGGYQGAITMSSGTLRVNQYVKNLNTALASGWALNISGGVLITNNTPVFFVGNTGIGAIRHNGNFTWKLMGFAYLNTEIQATSGTITYQIGSAANVIVDSNVQ